MPLAPEPNKETVISRSAASGAENLATHVFRALATSDIAAEERVCLHIQISCELGSHV